MTRLYLQILAALVVGSTAGPSALADQKQLSHALADADHAAEDAGTLATDYCESFSNVAAELRAKRQKEELESLKAALDRKLSEMNVRTAELRDMIARRDKMLSLASDELLEIYSQMEAEPAALQLEKINVDTAASVLRRLKPTLASEILAVMDVKRAAALIQIIANQNAVIQHEGKS